MLFVSLGCRSSQESWECFGCGSLSVARDEIPCNNPKTLRTGIPLKVNLAFRQAKKGRKNKVTSSPLILFFNFELTVVKSYISQ